MNVLWKSLFNKSFILIFRTVSLLLSQFYFKLYLFFYFTAFPVLCQTDISWPFKWNLYSVLCIHISVDLQISEKEDTLFKRIYYVQLLENANVRWNVIPDANLQFLYLFRLIWHKLFQNIFFQLQQLTVKKIIIRKIYKLVKTIVSRNFDFCLPNVNEKWSCLKKTVAEWSSFKFCDGNFSLREAEPRARALVAADGFLHATSCTHSTFVTRKHVK